ncbi:MAG: AbrB/MazE/SpoVT family DNA-binding domain-containing protein [Candidatus Kapaibacterium sp.]
MMQLVIDSNGKVPIPPEVMRKFGLAPGSKVNFEDTPDKMIIEPITKLPQKRQSMSDMTGFLGKDAKSLRTLMDERRSDREKEDSPFGS